MTWKQLAIWIVLGDFVLLTAWAIFHEGYFAFVPLLRDLATSNPWGAQMAIDFMLAIAISGGFVIADARRRGIAAWPFVLLTLTLGSIGPLSYLIHRERRAVYAARGRAARQEPVSSPA